MNIKATGRLNITYKTELNQLIIPEYGRNIQLLVEYIVNNMPDKDERSRAAATLVNLMAQQNPQLKNQPEYLQRLWDQLYFISDYKLDVDSPFPKPDAKTRKYRSPKKIDYPVKALKYHFYGENVLLMIKKALDMEESESKEKYIATIAGYMKLSYKTWNDDKVSDEIIIRHLAELSGGKIVIDRISDSFSNGKPMEKPFQKDFRKSKPRWYGNNKRNR
jgi:hypothetical protein